MQADRDRRQDRLTRRQRDCRTETEGRELVSWCFELSQPQMATSGLRREREREGEGERERQREKDRERGRD